MQKTHAHTHTSKECLTAGESEAVSRGARVVRRCKTRMIRCRTDTRALLQEQEQALWCAQAIDPFTLTPARQGRWTRQRELRGKGGAISSDEWEGCRREGDEQVERELQGQDRGEEEAKESEGRSKYSSEDTRLALWVSGASLNAGSQSQSIKSKEK